MASVWKNERLGWRTPGDYISTRLFISRSLTTPPTGAIRERAREREGRVSTSTFLHLDFLLSYWREICGRLFMSASHPHHPSNSTITMSCLFPHLHYLICRRLDTFWNGQITTSSIKKKKKTFSLTFRKDPHGNTAPAVTLSQVGQSWVLAMETRRWNKSD